MYTFHVKYTDYDDHIREEDYYFHLTKTELTQMENGIEGGLEKELRVLLQKHDVPKMMDFYKRIILDSYGEKSPDGKRFIKNAQLKEEFEQTAAFDEIYMQLIQEDGLIEKFIRGIMPSDLAAQITDEAIAAYRNGEIDRNQLAVEKAKAEALEKKQNDTDKTVVDSNK